ncbi:hypothetical protein E2C01_069287 [Portunus trituberculatus]|uniref:Uncharacterized protein n=1 Tax=Portunus trituberculatus TaxID=210409 RepID=A0A5B7I079_PORTR|nr:hypothetical protein [Portunus trituberculatus]
MVEPHNKQSHEAKSGVTQASTNTSWVRRDYLLTNLQSGKSCCTVPAAGVRRNQEPGGNASYSRSRGKQGKGTVYEAGHKVTYKDINPPFYDHRPRCPSVRDCRCTGTRPRRRAINATKEAAPKTPFTAPSPPSHQSSGRLPRHSSVR